MGASRLPFKNMEKYKEILSVLTKQLESGKYRVGERFPSEWQLVERFKVGRATINKAVDKLVADGWLERGVRGSGTRVKSVHQLIRGRILYLGNLAHPTYVAAVRGMTSRAFFRGYFTACAEPPDFELDSFLSTAVAMQEYSGIVACCYGVIGKRYPGLPVVYLDQPGISLKEYAELHHVISDNEEACYKMMKVVETRGYRCPVIYTDNNCRLNERFSRVLGFRKALEEMKLNDLDRRIFVGSQNDQYTKAGAAMQLQNILRVFPETDAIVAVSDDLAVMMRQALRDAGPEQERILVTGFGNEKLVSNAFQLPSVEQYPEQMGIAAADLLLDLVEGIVPDTVPCHRIVKTDLVNLEYIPQRREI